MCVLKLYRRAAEQANSTGVSSRRWDGAGDKGNVKLSLDKQREDGEGCVIMTPGSGGTASGNWFVILPCV